MAWRYVVQAGCPAVRSFVRCMASFLALRPLELRMLPTPPPPLLLRGAWESDPNRTLTPRSNDQQGVGRGFF